MTEKLLDLGVALAAFFTQKEKPQDAEGGILPAVGDSPRSIFEAEPGEWRLLQPIWDLRLGYEEYVGSPMFPIIMSVGFYFALITPFTIMDLYGQNISWIKKYKIQPDAEVKWPHIKKAVILTMWNHLLYILPISLAQWVWQPILKLPKMAPSLFEFCWHQFACLVVFDLFYFVWHWYHHYNRWLYRHVHSVHHQYYVCNSWVTQYLHPWELISVGFMTTFLPLTFKFHPLTNYSFLLMNIIVSTEDHIGYDFPLFPHRWAPFWGGSTKHDMHHQKPLTNFQPHFNTFDVLFGTHCPGVQAGGVKPPELLEWERKKREQNEIRKAEKQRMKAMMAKAVADVAKEKQG